MAMLGEPKRIAIGIVHVKLARAPTLIDRTFMDFLRSVRIPGRAQPSLPKLAKDCVNVIARNDNHLTKFPVARVAREEESISIARQRAPVGSRAHERTIAPPLRQLAGSGRVGWWPLT